MMMMMMRRNRLKGAEGKEKVAIRSDDGDNILPLSFRLKTFDKDRIYSTCDR
jgi:hypothetical protein